MCVLMLWDNSRMHEIRTECVLLGMSVIALMCVNLHTLVVVT